MTEIAAALGLEAQLVGRSHECDHPPGVARLPALTEPKLDANAPSRAIDDRVKQLVSEGLSVYRVDAERLRGLAPTAILTQDHCEVCAASLSDVEQALGDWLGEKPRVVSQDPRTLGDVWAGILDVGEALGCGDRARALTARLSWELTELAEQARSQAERPRVACVEWIDPLMAAGNWMPELVTLAGGVNRFGAIGAHSPWLSWPELRDADPDVIVVLPCGFDLPRTRKELGPLLAQPGFDALRAVREGRVYLADGHRFFNRPGPRLVESLRLLCEMLHPGAFAPDGRGDGWDVLSR